jgi:hypothetical protein
VFLSKPEPVTIVLCDHVHLDPGEEAQDAGRRLSPRRRRCVPLHGAQGIVELAVRVLEGETVLFQAGGKATLGDPNSN